MANIHDIAKCAEVSVSTVSRAFNQPQSLSPATLKRVRQVAQALNYMPNTDARNLRRAGRNTGKLTHTVGFLAVAKTIIAGDPFAHELFESVVAAVTERGYGLRVIAASPDGDIPRAIEQGEVDGVICRFSSPMVREIAQRMPTVSLDYHDPDAEGYAVIPDYEGGLRSVMERLFAAGHRRIALMANNPDNLHQRGFWNIFPNTCRQAYHAHGIPLPANLFLGAASDARQGYALGLSLLQDADHRPDAVIGPDAAMQGFYRAAAEQHVSIPDALSVVGVNGLRLGEFLPPPLTTLDVQIRRMGGVAVGVLLDNIQSDTRRRGVEITPVELCIRGSAQL